MISIFQITNVIEYLFFHIFSDYILFVIKQDFNWKVEMLIFQQMKKMWLKTEHHFLK